MSQGGQKFLTFNSQDPGTLTLRRPSAPLSSSTRPSRALLRAAVRPEDTMPTPIQNADPLLTPPEAGAYVGAATQTLACARCTRVGVYATIPWIKTGRRVFYRRSDLDAWLTAHRVAIEAGA